MFDGVQKDPDSGRYLCVLKHHCRSVSNISETQSGRKHNQYLGDFPPYTLYPVP